VCDQPCVSLDVRVNESRGPFIVTKVRASKEREIKRNQLTTFPYFKGEPKLDLF